MIRNKHSLFSFAVTVQDTGKYMVKAVNSGGEAQSIADFLVVESQPDRMVEITKTTVFSDLPVNQPRVSSFHLLNIIYFFTFPFYSKSIFNIFVEHLQNHIPN